MKSPVRSKQLFHRASQILPGGVDSPVRAFQAVGGTPLFITRASGAVIEDVDGNRFIDYVMSWGPLIHGHAPLSLVRRIAAAARRGTSFGAPSPLEHELGERVRTLMPSLERIRFVSSGTEAAMSAIRVARAYTRRDKIVKFEGCYHGHADAFLVKAGSGALTLGIPTSPGVPAPVAADTLLARYNDLQSVDALLAEHDGAIAAIIVEPIAGNIGVVAPADDFLTGLRERCTRSGILLIFDEVISGFRASAGGAQAIFGVRPDLTCLGKIIGGGLPVGAYGGRAALMDMVAPAGPVYQAGTLSGNPVAMTAGLWALERLRPKMYKDLAARGSMLAAGLAVSCAGCGSGRANQRVRLAPHAVLHVRTGARLSVGAVREHLRLCDVLQRHVETGSVSTAVTIRGVVPFDCAHRDAHQENDCRRAQRDEGRRERSASRDLRR